MLEQQLEGRNIKPTTMRLLVLKKLIETGAAISLADLLRNNGKIGVLDGFRKQNDWITKTLDFLPNSNISRNISEYLSELTDNYRKKPLCKTGVLFIGIGEKTK